MFSDVNIYFVLYKEIYKSFSKSLQHFGSSLIHTSTLGNSKSVMITSQMGINLKAFLDKSITM